MTVLCDVRPQAGIKHVLSHQKADILRQSTFQHIQITPTEAPSEGYRMISVVFKSTEKKIWKENIKMLRKI